MTTFRILAVGFVSFVVFANFPVRAEVLPAPAVAADWEPLFENVASDFETIYALEDYKYRRFKWRREKELDLLYSHLVDLGKRFSPPAAQRLFKTFFRRTRDYHSDIFYQTDIASAELPFGVRTVDGRAYVTQVNRSLAPKDRFPAAIGDELVEFDGMPVKEALNRLIPRPLNAVITDRTDADRFLTKRPGYQGWGLPKGDITLVFRRKADRRVFRIEWKWRMVPNAVAFSAALDRPLVDPRVLMDEVAARRTYVEDVDVINTVGYRDPFVPAIGRTKWRSDDRAQFFAEIGVTERGTRVGFVRVPSYYPRNPAAAVAEFEGLMARMQADTDVLIYDQTNNGGGSVLYFYELLSRMIRQPVRSPLHWRWSLQPMNFHLGKSWKDLEESLRDVSTDEQARKVLGDTVAGYPVTLEVARGAYREASNVLEDIDRSKLRVSRPMPLLMIDKIVPKGRPYAKPIILLQNEWSFSAADMAPAVMQDIGRAVIFGTKAPGLGAYVISRAPPAVNPLKVWLHRLSMAEVTRARGAPIENAGVEPDVPHELTDEDLTRNFSAYRRKLTDLADRMGKRLAAPKPAEN